MGRAPCCDKANVKKGPWSQEEDAKLKDYIDTNGTGGNWIALPQKAGLRRCGKSCRLRWLNYLRPNIKHGDFTEDEDRVICSLYATIGSRWSIIAAQLPSRTDNDIKNYWNTKLKKKFMAFVSASTTTANPTMYSAHSQLTSLYNYNYASNPTITTNPNPNPNSNSTKTMMDQPLTLHQLTSNKTSKSCMETSLSLLQTQMHNHQYYHPLMFGSCTTDQQTSCSSNNSENGGSCVNKDIGRFQNFTSSSVVIPSALYEQDENRGLMLNYEENNHVFMSQFDTMNSSSEHPALLTSFYDIEGGHKQLDISINDHLSLINISDQQNYQMINNKVRVLDHHHQVLMKERDQRMIMNYFNSNYY